MLEEENVHQMKRKEKEDFLTGSGYHPEAYEHDHLDKIVSQLTVENEIDRRILFEVTGTNINKDDFEEQYDYDNWDEL